MSNTNIVLNQRGNESFGTLYDLNFQPITNQSQIQPDLTYLFARHLHSSEVAEIYFAQSDIPPLNYKEATKVETITILDKNPNIFGYVFYALMQIYMRSKGGDNLIFQQLTKVKDNDTNQTKNMGMIKFRNTCLFSVS